MTHPAVEAALRDPVERGDVPFVSAIAVNAHDIMYAGGFGSAREGVSVRADSIVRIASMTKALTSLCAIQLVERGSLTLDGPAAEILPELAEAQVLGADGSLRAPTRPVTLRALLTHTSGYAYPFLSSELARYVAGRGDADQPGWEIPLLFDPGGRWQYGVSTDWVGLMVEAASGLSLDAYMARHVLEPLAMADTSFAIPEAKEDRLTSLYGREEDGSLVNRGVAPGVGRSTHRGRSVVSGGGGLTSTALDYGRFLRSMLRGGELDGVRLLGPEGFAGMTTDQIGGLVAGAWKTSSPAVSNDVDFTDGGTAGHTLGFLIARRGGPTGRAAGTLSWAGIFNSYYWIDRARGVAGATFCQFLPFADRKALALHEDFQRAIYGSV